jgi:hypothetical protein
MRKLFVFLVLCLPLMGQVTLQDVSIQDMTISTVAAGCNEFTDDFTAADLSAWSQSSDTDFSLDAVNDELDHATGGGNDLILRDDTTTDEDQCVLGCAVTGWYTSGDSGGGLVLRGSLTNADTIYAMQPYYGTWRVEQHSISYGNPVRNGVAWAIGESGHVDAGDCAAWCVAGTSTSTSLEAWFWDSSAAESPSGPCKSDWGTADYNTTGCGSYCVDATDQLVVGFFGFSGYAFTVDYLAGSDN